MRISHRCEYALRALLELAKSSQEGPVRIEDIARRQTIPKKFLANLLVQLKRGRFVQSKKGPEGGYYLARSARQIMVGDVVRFIEGPLGPIQCVNRTTGERCEIGTRCGFLPLWKRVRDAVAEIVDRTTIADVLAEQEREAAASAKVLMYHI
ncbi:MAG: Rrf2 family transcriptional regulator [Deltaproteobacteria bacterium]|nr:Rrf2 family transcriptional regulator [Deltaproteobacteria bacterium]